MKASLGASPEHYRKLHLQQEKIEPWEDGMRTHGGAGSFEWWYLDAHLDDGSKLVITFYTKPPYASPSQPLTPFVSVSLDRNDGTRIERDFTAAPESFAASPDRCDVRIGANTFAGDLSHYRVHVEIDDLEVDVDLRSEVPPWRPATGHVFFGDDEEHYVAWLPASPGATVTASIRVAGKATLQQGTGYHDHNWGNAALRHLVDYWYWGRARVGEHTLITLMFVTNDSYGKREIPAFMIAAGGEIVAQATEGIRFSATNPTVNEEAGVPVARTLAYEFDHLDTRYAVEFSHRQDLLVLNFGRAGAYLRFAGDVTLRKQVAGDAATTARQAAMWELLYFGPRVPTANAVPQGQ